MSVHKLSKYEVADLIQLVVARHYEREWKEPSFVVIGRFADFDICSLSKKHRVEVKFESTPSRTGNLCFEYWNIDLDEPSGILATQANLWLHIIPTAEGWVGFEFEVDRLRRAVIELGESRTNGSNAIFKIIPLSDARKLARRQVTLKSRLLDLISGSDTVASTVR